MLEEIIFEYLLCIHQCSYTDGGYVEITEVASNFSLLGEVLIDFSTFKLSLKQCNDSSPA